MTKNRFANIDLIKILLAAFFVALAVAACPGCNRDDARVDGATASNDFSTAAADLAPMTDLACSPSITIRSVGPAEGVGLVLVSSPMIMATFWSLNIAIWQSFNLDSTPRTAVQSADHDAFPLRTATIYGANPTTFVGAGFIDSDQIFMFDEHGVIPGTMHYPGNMYVGGFYNNGASAIAFDYDALQLVSLRINADATADIVRRFRGAGAASLVLPIGDSLLADSWTESQYSFVALAANGAAKTLATIENPDCMRGADCWNTMHIGRRAFATGTRPGDVSVWYVFRNDWAKPSYLWSFSLADPNGETTPFPGTIQDVVQRTKGGWVAADNPWLVTQKKDTLRLRFYNEKASELPGELLMIEDITPSEYGDRAQLATIDDNHFVVIYVTGGEGHVAFVSTCN